MATEQESTSARPDAAHVLVVEDAPEFQHLLRQILSADGYRVSTAADGARALELARSMLPDVVLLDVVLPGIDGLEVCRQLRAFSDAYVLMVTSRTDEVDLLVGLAVGADDYITKPFSSRELTARIAALLRRPRSAATVDAPKDLGDLHIDRNSREVRIGSVPIHLTKIEFDLLDALTQNTKRVLSRTELLEAIWGPNWVGDHHVIDVHIANLRKKIDRPGSTHIVTVRGVGYRFAAAGAQSKTAA